LGSVPDLGPADLGLVPGPIPDLGLVSARVRKPESGSGTGVPGPGAPTGALAPEPDARARTWNTGDGCPESWIRSTGSLAPTPGPGAPDRGTGHRAPRGPGPDPKPGPDLGPDLGPGPGTGSGNRVPGDPEHPAPGHLAGGRGLCTTSPSGV